jgi:GAF domain-containing protein
VPLIKDGAVHGVLDLDSPLFARFDDEDRRAFEAIVRTFINGTDFVRHHA